MCRTQSERTILPLYPHCHLFVPLCKSLLSFSLSPLASLFRLSQRCLFDSFLLYHFLFSSAVFSLEFFFLLSLAKKSLQFLLLSNTAREIYFLSFHFNGMGELQLQFHRFDERISWRTSYISVQRINCCNLTTDQNGYKHSNTHIHRESMGDRRRETSINILIALGDQSHILFHPSGP